jgi:hypothetical protein
MMEALSSSETSVLTRAHAALTFQKTPFFIATAFKTSDLIQDRNVPDECDDR